MQKNKDTKNTRDSRFWIQDSRRGFTLVETLVAISIFSFSILSILTVTSLGVANTNFAKNKFIASYLAQEGIELVKNYRDTLAQNTTEGQDYWVGFLSQLNSCINEEAGIPKGCDIDPLINFSDSTSGIISCDSVSGCPLIYDLNSGFYVSRDVENNIGFSRLITLKKIDSNLDDEVLVSVKVFWQQGSKEEVVEYQTNLFRWQ